MAAIIYGSHTQAIRAILPLTYPELKHPVKEKGPLKRDKIDGSEWMMHLDFYFPRGEWEEKDQVNIVKY